MIKWGKEHHLNLGERRHTSDAEDVESMLLMLGRAIAPPAGMEEVKE